MRSARLAGKSDRIPSGPRSQDEAVPPYASLIATPSTHRPFERTSKRRRGYPSETRVKRGDRTVHRDKELHEKLGRRDPCPCGSGLRFQRVLHAPRSVFDGVLRDEYRRD